MPDSIGGPSFSEGLDVDYIYEDKGMTPEEIKEVDNKFQELYPSVHTKVLEAFSAKMEPVGVVSPRAVLGGSQGIYMTPAIYAVTVDTEEVKSASLRYIFKEGDLTTEERAAIDDIARNYNKNRDQRPTI